MTKIANAPNIASTTPSPSTLGNPPATLQEGDSSHTVVKGETLTSIAKQHEMPVDDLISANHQIKDPNRIWPGDQVRIPGEASSVTSSAPPVAPPAPSVAPTANDFVTLDPAAHSVPLPTPAKSLPTLTKRISETPAPVKVEQPLPPVTQTASGLSVKPGFLVPPEIDKSELGFVDAGIIEAMQFEDIPPGGSVEIKGAISADGAAVLGLHAGADVSMTIKRDAKDPNKFTLGMGAGGEGGVLANLDSTAGTAGYEAGIKGGLAGGVKVEMSIDLSKPGEAKELAGFAGHMMAAGVLPSAMSAGIGLIESLPGIKVPGEPAPFIAEHISALEVQAGTKVGGDLAGSVFGGAKGTATRLLQAGGRVDFHPNGDKTFALNGTVTDELKLAAQGGDALYGVVDVGSAKIQLGAKSSVTFDQHWTPTNIANGVQFSGGGAASAPPATVGVQLSGEVTLSLLKGQFPQLAQKLETAMIEGDSDAVKAVVQDLAATGALTFKGQATGTVSVAGDVGLKLKEVGVGAEGKLSGQVTYSAPIASGQLVLTQDGIAVKGDSDFGLFKVEGQGDVTYEQMMEAMQEINHQDLYFYAR